MPTYCLLRTLILTQELEWKLLVQNVLGAEVHPQRAHDFALSRGALQLCLKKYGVDLEIHQLILENYCTVKNLDSLTISITHTSNCGAAAVGLRGEFVSVGIDIEPVSRIVKPLILERISHAGDEKLPPLTVWSVKEASFKALMNTSQFLNPVEFSSIKISQNFWEHPESNTKGEWRTTLEDDLLVALAWIKT